MLITLFFVAFLPVLLQSLQVLGVRGQDVEMVSQDGSASGAKAFCKLCVDVCVCVGGCVSDDPSFHFPIPTLHRSRTQESGQVIQSFSAQPFVRLNSWGPPTNLAPSHPPILTLHLRW